MGQDAQVTSLSQSKQFHTTNETSIADVHVLQVYTTLQNYAIRCPRYPIYYYIRISRLHEIFMFDFWCSFISAVPISGPFGEGTNNSLSIILMVKTLSLLFSKTTFTFNI